ncbi:monooxygenase [Microbacterium hibisci]|uniref:monooxygenase n=1 Tax=Microbacterium hibisci TaxID=2036000 RepID=UPI0019456F0D|nr:monooxygenase [Microbacterium hibisci]
MAHLLVFEFPSPGPYGDEAVAAFGDLARDIAGEQGLVFKVWTEDPGTGIAGGAYLFETKADAERYLAFHTERLNGFGVTDIDARSYPVNDGLSAITGIPPR